jgi:hypothetical protein
VEGVGGCLPNVSFEEELGRARSTRLGVLVAGIGQGVGRRSR